MWFFPYASYVQNNFIVIIQITIKPVVTQVQSNDQNIIDQ